jgi:hypothetical protein
MRILSIGAFAVYVSCHLTELGHARACGKKRNPTQTTKNNKKTKSDCAFWLKVQIFPLEAAAFPEVS